MFERKEENKKNRENKENKDLLRKGRGKAPTRLRNPRTPRAGSASWPIHLLSKSLMVLFGLLVMAVTRPASAQDPHALLVHADRVRNAWQEGVLKLRVTTTKPGAAPSTGLFEVMVKGGEKSRIRFLDPAEAGKAVVTVRDDAWLLLPTASNPIKVPKSHRLGGGFSIADISRTKFSEDYDATLERTDELNGRTCDVIRLLAKKGSDPTYPVVRVWIDRTEGLYRRAIFLVQSGKTAKDTTFESYKSFHGVLAISTMTIVDALRSGTTFVEYLEAEKRPVSDAVFDLKTARTE